LPAVDVGDRIHEHAIAAIEGGQKSKCQSGERQYPAGAERLVKIVPADGAAGDADGDVRPEPQELYRGVRRCILTPRAALEARILSQAIRTINAKSRTNGSGGRMEPLPRRPLQVWAVVRRQTKICRPQLTPYHRRKPEENRRSEFCRLFPVVPRPAAMNIDSERTTTVADAEMRASIITSGRPAARMCISALLTGSSRDRPRHIVVVAVQVVVGRHIAGLARSDHERDVEDGVVVDRAEDGQ
jgi:hypothetical protein